MTSLEREIANMTGPELIAAMIRIVEEIQLRLMQLAGEEERNAG